MATFDWNECFVTGLPEVDRQHSHLVDVINRFGKQQSTCPAGSDDLRATYRELSDYARYHFQEEEALMASVGVDARHVDQHHRAHRAFAEELESIGKSISSQDEGSGARLLRLLTRWLAHHILGQDQRMAKQIAAISAGETPAAAFEAEEDRRNSATDPLLRALDSLFEELTERNHELHQLNHTLEARVAERTEALLEANRRLETLATTDVLTGLPNRRRAMTELAKEWAATDTPGRHLSCLLIDVDGFKQINDRHGHHAGDEILRQLALAMQDAVRSDDLVCRLGGDEFLVICPRTPIEGALQLAEKIRQEVSALRVSAGSGIWKGSISIGAATRQPGMASFDALIKLADKGVYLSKHKGRNRVSVSS